MSDPNGLTNKELLLRLDGKLDAFVESLHVHKVQVAHELGRRPTRMEIYTLATVIGAIVGALVGSIQ